MNPALEKLQTQAPLHSCWLPAKGDHKLHWKVVRHFAATDDNGAVLQLEKYQGGRNSPAYLTLNRLLAHFRRIESPMVRGRYRANLENPWRKSDYKGEIENYEV